MQTHNLIQGDPSWHAHRSQYKNASDSPAVLGESKYKSRSQLLAERHSGITPEVNAATQRLFDDGHRFESLARPLAEKIIGEELSPVTGTEGEFGASFDGITFGGDVIWEHKTLNDDIRKVQFGDNLPLCYKIQMEHQLMVSGACKCLFMASKWDSSDALIEEKHFWYEPDLALRAEIVAAWDQFAKDLEAFIPPEATDKPVADAIMQLPAVTIQVTGALSACNLSDVTPLFDRFLAEANTELKTDDDFANGEATAKFSRTTAKNLKLKAVEVVDQIATVSEAVRTLELYAAKFDKLGLVLEKAVKDQKEVIKATIMGDAKRAFMDHVDALYQETKPIELAVPQPDFNGVMKGQRTLESLRNKVNTELARVKIEADAVAKDIRGKLALFKPYAEFDFLFRDLPAIIQKPADDFMLIVGTRIAQHKAAEAEKIEAQRVAIQKEEQEKAEAKVRAEQEAEKISAMENVLSAVAEDAKERKKSEIATAVSNAVIYGTSMPETRQERELPPSRDALIGCVAFDFGVSIKTAEQWLTTEFQQRAA